MPSPSASPSSATRTTTSPSCWPRTGSQVVRPGQLHGAPEGGDSFDDGRLRTVIEGELLDDRAGKVPSEARHVDGRGAAEAVDGLARVADHPQPRAVARDLAQQQTRRAIDVLVLVDQHVAVLPPHARANARVGVQQVDRAGDQVAEVDLPTRLQLLLVPGVDPRHLERLLGAHAPPSSESARSRMRLASSVYRSGPTCSSLAREMALMMSRRFSVGSYRFW